ncbi:hypothetical protein AAVH_12931 [Aphelenchoides avenae]|nr:hypothetical protein AAVH_12931 [Aphelenchus avenae]
MLLGMIAYVYGDSLAMIAPILCHLWLQLNVAMFRQALHYLIFLVAYGVSLVAITISSIVWMAFMANKDNMSKHTTVRLARNNERLFVVVIWFILQLLIAVLGGFLLYLAFLAYKLQKAASEGQGLLSSERHVESASHKVHPLDVHAAPLDSRQSHAIYREESTLHATPAVIRK